MTRSARFWPAFVCVCAICSAGCGRGSEPASPPAHGAAVDVPPPPAASKDDQDHSSHRAQRGSDGVEPESGEVDVEVTYDGGAVTVSSSSDGGVRVWGSLTRYDGGFSFQGGFSTGSSVGDRDAAP